MAYFRLLNLRSVEKALADLFDSLARTNKLCLLPNLVKEKSLCHRKVPMDGFTLFTSSPLIKPYTWFLGNHKVNIVQFLRVYEELASLPLSMVGTAGEVASKIYSKTSEERKVFLKFKEGEWLNPSLLLAAAAQYLGPEGVTASRSGVRMDLGGGRIEVTRAGCYSNLRRQIIPHESEYPELNDVITRFPDIATDNPVLVALYELCDESDARFAVTVAAHALYEEVIGKGYLVKIAHLDTPAAKKSATTVRNPLGAAEAMEKCEKILDDAALDVVQELYAAAVPSLLTYKKLQSIVGTPAQHEGRAIKRATLNTWREKLRTVYEEVANAVA